MAILGGIGHFRYLFEVTFKTDYFFGSIKILSILGSIVRIGVRNFC